MNTLTGNHDTVLVVISLIIASLGAYVAIDLIYLERPGKRWFGFFQPVFLAASSLGLSIWAMHFIGMIAFQLPVSVAYDAVMTLLSLSIAIVGCVFGFYWLIKGASSSGSVMAAGFAVGLAISGMHYSGMAAMSGPFILSFDYPKVLLSIVVAVIIASASAWVLARIRLRQWQDRFSARVLAALLMGLAISGMHYLSMSHTHFRSTPRVHEQTWLLSGEALPITVVSAVVLLMILALKLTATMKHWLQELTLENDSIRIKHTKLNAIIEHVGDAIVAYDQNGLVTLFNPAAEALFGYHPNEITGRSVTDLFTDYATDKSTSAINVLFSHQSHFRCWSFAVEGRKKTGDTLPLEVKLTEIEDETEQRSIAVISDISEYRQELNRLTHLAHYDPLTGLANRLLIMNELKRALNAAKRHHYQLHVLYIDLDGFKQINDRFGHETGDRLLTQVAQTLLQNVRNHDLVGRLAGDEFLIVLEHTKTPTPPTPLMEALLTSIRAIPERMALDLPVTISIGVAGYPEHGQTLEALIDHADCAMYQAKTSGKNRFCLYRPDCIAVKEHDQKS